MYALAAIILGETILGPDILVFTVLLLHMIWIMSTILGFALQLSLTQVCFVFIDVVKLLYVLKLFFSLKEIPLKL